RTTVLSNLGTSAVTFSSAVSTEDGQNWLSQSPASGSIASGTSTTMTLKADTTGLAAGIRRGSARGTFSDGTIRDIGVALVLVSSTGGGAAPSSKARDASGSCDLALEMQGSVSPNATLVALQPADLKVKMTDCNGADVDTGSVQITFSNRDA